MSEPSRAVTGQLVEDLTTKRSDQAVYNVDEIPVSALQAGVTVVANHPEDSLALSECVAQDDRDTKQWCVSPSEYETLRYHHQHTPDIILHSSEPKTSPHIIISAPYEDAWSGMVSAEMNRLNPQCPEGLTVPHCIPWEPPVEQAVEVDGFEADASSGPALVYLRRVTNEQESSLRVRQRFRHCAYEASGVARMQRQRYDFSLGVFSHLETPFVWIDPAEHMLLQCKYFASTLVLDSLNPFKAPHIVIFGAEVQHPWYAEYNRPTYPQDAAFLRVPMPDFHQAQAEEPVVEEQWVSVDEEVYELLPGDDDLFQDDEEDVVVALGSARSDSPTSSSGTLCHDESDDTYSSFDDSSSGFSTPVYPSGSLPWDSRFHIDEDDEELPPLDVEWCARAARLGVLTGAA